MGGMVQAMARSLVVAVVGEAACREVDAIGPVLVFATGVEDDEALLVPLTRYAEPAHVADAGNELRERIVS